MFSWTIYKQGACPEDTLGACPEVELEEGYILVQLNRYYFIPNLLSNSSKSLLTSLNDFY